jgi:hypothetical protein
MFLIRHNIISYNLNIYIYSRYKQSISQSNRAVRVARLMMSTLIFDKANLDTYPFVKELIRSYFNVEHDEIVHRLHLHDKYVEAKRINVYNYFLKSKTGLELKQRTDVKGLGTEPDFTSQCRRFCCVFNE